MVTCRIRRRRRAEHHAPDVPATSTRAGRSSRAIASSTHQANRPPKGVNRSGAEFMCAQGRGLRRSVRPSPCARAWRVTAVRIPMNEACWLAINGVNRSTRGDLSTGHRRVRGHPELPGDHRHSRLALAAGTTALSRRYCLIAITRSISWKASRRRSRGTTRSSLIYSMNPIPTTPTRPRRGGAGAMAGRAAE